MKTSNYKKLNNTPLKNVYNEPIKSALKKDPQMVENQEEILQQMPRKNKPTSKKKNKKQKDRGVVIYTNKVISWKNSLDLIIRIGLIAIATLGIMLGLFFKNKISKSRAHWNIMWLLNMHKYDHDSGFQTFLHENAFLIVSIIYITIFILPLTVFSKKRLFTIFFIIYFIGIVIWSAFACLGVFQYNTFKKYTTIALLELISLATSWVIFFLLSLKLIKYKKRLKNQ